jgi:hypothetical protein
MHDIWECGFNEGGSGRGDEFEYLLRRICFVADHSLIGDDYDSLSTTIRIPYSAIVYKPLDF